MAIAIQREQNEAREFVSRALKAHREGRLRESLELYEEALRIDDTYFDALFLQGGLCIALGDAARAARRLAKAIDVDPSHSRAHLLLGAAHQIAGRPYAALLQFEKAAERDPMDCQAPFHIGNILRIVRRPAKAIEAYERSRALGGPTAELFVNLANALMDLGRREEALAYYDRALGIKPDFPAAHFNRANTLKALGRVEAAVASYDRAIALNPGFATALNNRGVALRELGRHAEALRSLDAALQVQPDYPEALNNRGVSSRDLGIDVAALEDFHRALALRPSYGEARRNRGALLLSLRRFEEALEDFDLAAKAESFRADIHNGRAVALHALRRPAEALLALEQALSIKPTDAAALGNRGIMLGALGRADEAIASLRAALDSTPNDPATLGRLGATLLEAGRVDEAAPYLDAALRYDPGRAYALGDALGARMRLCDWADYESGREALATASISGRAATSPFALLSLSDEPSAHRAAARTWIAREVVGPVRRVRAYSPMRGERLRIGYLSADFRGHAMANLMIDVFRRHDRARVETIAFKLGGADDAMTRQLRGCFDRFEDVSTLSDAEAARACREARLDVAVDLMGLTRASRPDILAHGAAPIQIGFLGYPGPMGDELIDYVIADEVVIPEAARGAYAERVILMPGSYYPSSHRALASELPAAPTRAALGLPERGFVFCCFNNTHKINPETFDLWMELLLGIEGSALWLMEERRAASVNLRKRASAYGVDPSRLVFAPKKPWQEHLARHRVADLFLDTLPYNAHTMAVDALWTGLPVLTTPGKSFAARVAASVLTCLDLTELIADSRGAYISKARELAQTHERLAAIRSKLAARADSSTLFDSAAFAGALEAAYRGAADRWRAGLPTETFAVKPWER